MSPPDHDAPIAGDRLWPARVGLGILVAVLTAVSWERWANPIVDCGREMYVPWRLAAGEMLYRDVFFIYGPLVPYWHAALFRIFGEHLGVLYVAGLAVGCAHVFVVFALARRILPTDLAALAAALVTVEFVFHPSVNNLVFPYSFNASYASLLNLVVALCLLQSDGGRNRPFVLLAGLCVGLSCTSRQDFGLGAAGLFAAYSGAALPRADRATRRTIALGTMVALVVVVVGYAPFVYALGFDRLVEDSLWPRRMLAAMEPFEHAMVGATLDPALVVGLVMRATAILAIIVLVVGLVYASEARRSGLGLVLLMTAAVVIARSPFVAAALEFMIRNAVHATNPVVIVLAAIVAGRCDRQTARDVRWLAFVALAQTWRVPVFGGLSAYSAFYVPAGVPLLVWLSSDGWSTVGRVRDRGRWRRATALLCAAWCALVLVAKVGVFRGAMTEQITTERGTLYAPAPLGAVLREQLELVRAMTGPEEPVLLLPEDNAVHFLAARRSIRRYYQLIPGILDAAGEQEVIASAEREGVRLVTVSNRAMTVYGATFFGRDYDQAVFAWLQSHFVLARRLGNPVHPATPVDPSQMFPSEGYGVDVYVREPVNQGIRGGGGTVPSGGRTGGS